jgi:hypothetical protein
VPAPTGIIDALTSPPFASLQQVLDTNGPYVAGDYTLTSFTTGGAFLLPAGTYDLGGTFGVFAEVTAIPAEAGLTFGWNDATEPIISGDRYEDRMLQLCLIRTLPISGAHVITEVHDQFIVAQLYLWPVLLGSATRLGLHVNPGYECDLFFMCVL